MKQEGFFPSLGVYVPELWAFQQKDSPACRELLEDVALLDLSEKRILSSRGKRFATPLPDACWALLEAPCLVSEKKGTLLLFPIHKSDLCQTLALFLPYAANLVSASLITLDRKEFSGMTKPSGDDPDLVSLLAELLFYLDRLLLDPPALPLWTVVLRAANFAGCKLKRDNLPASDLKLSKEEIPLFFSFLICFFLSVRERGNAAEVGLESASPRYCIHFGAISGNESPAEIPNAPFLDCAAFRRFSMTQMEKGHRLLLSLRAPGAEVSSAARPRYTTISIECVRE